MKYMKLDQKGYCMAEYIWIDGSNGVRSKTKVRPHLPTHLIVVYPNQALTPSLSIMAS